ncbi:hypothetical protein B7R22_16400 [Subtercola boreus]|uniref:DUF4436 domain-containing protein n=1 Tax=Subtercola boreus TaxID=120213 RepID=A0A3E0VQV3_9MICO|nr:hypothetical protein B7R22_16400 [Subtercola boreus]
MHARPAPSSRSCRHSAATWRFPPRRPSASTKRPGLRRSPRWCSRRSPPAPPPTTPASPPPTTWPPSTPPSTADPPDPRPLHSPCAEEICGQKWPFDTYRAELTTFAFTGEGDGRITVPTDACLDDSVPGWQLHTNRVDLTGYSVTTADGDTSLPTVEIVATRPASTVAFGIVLLGLMAVIPVLVLFVAISAYTGRRQVEATLTSWIGAMLFVVIPLRTFLPGSPPVGSWIDYLVVLRVIVGLVTGLTIYILLKGPLSRPRSEFGAIWVPSSRVTCGGVGGGVRGAGTGARGAVHRGACPVTVHAVAAMVKGMAGSSSRAWRSSAARRSGSREAT